MVCLLHLGDLNVGSGMSLRVSGSATFISRFKATTGYIQDLIAKKPTKKTPSPVLLLMLCKLLWEAFWLKSTDKCIKQTNKIFKNIC